MSSGLLFEQLHGNVNKKFIPISKFNGRYELTLGLRNYKNEVELLKEKVPQFFNHIYFIPNQIVYHFCYKKDLIYLDLHSLEWGAWEFVDQEKRIELWTKEIEESLKNKDFENIFSTIEKQILITQYIKWFKKIPDLQKYNCFRNLWTRSEYGFQLFTPLFLKEVFSFKDYSEIRNKGIEKLITDTNNKKIVTIYRGITHKSTDINKAISWTLDKKVADFFATRFNCDGQVFKAEICIDGIHDYLINRGEQEVLIDPDLLNHIEVIC